MLEREVLARNADLERCWPSSAHATLNWVVLGTGDRGRGQPREVPLPAGGEPRPAAAAERRAAFSGCAADATTDAVQADLVRRVDASFESAEELIRRCATSRARQPPLRGESRPVAISRFLRRLAIDLQPLAAAHGIDLRFVPSSEGVLSDPVLLRQIAQNLIINALKHLTGPKVVVGSEARRRGRLADGAGRRPRH
ncbi:MAG: hypothetical protein U1E59_01360 [Amaricoccus sp.]